MKDLAIVGDLHFGVHNSSLIHHEYMKKFFTDFFLYIDENKIDTVLQLGDMFDVRKFINTWSFRFFRENFLVPVLERDLTVYVLCGNHDIYYKESLEVSSIYEVLNPYPDNFKLIDKPTDCTIKGHSFLLVPWVCKENIDSVSNAIIESNSDYCAGHFEFDGFELFKGQMAKSHYKHSSYSKFKKVFSGHYHHMSSKDNVLYTGTPYELTWQDCDTTKGFFILNESEEIIFQENKHKLYAQFNVTEPNELEYIDINKKIVKVRINESWEPKIEDAFKDRINSMNPYDCKFIFPSKLVQESTTINQVEFSADTSIDSMINNYVSHIHVNETIDKERLNQVLIEMFQEAVTQ